MYENELHRLGIAVVYVMERIISSNAETAAIKGMHHVMNAEYSRKLSIRIGDGLREKFEAGYINGLPPFGWQRLPDGRSIRPFESEAATVLTFSERYATGQYSYKDIADWANQQTGHSTRDGQPWDKQRIADLILNPIHDGQVVWHPGEVDEETRPGEHLEFRIRPPALAAELARVRQERAKIARPSRKHLVYPYTGLMVCFRCGARLAGTPNRHGTPRMIHPSSNCPDKSYHSLKTWDRQIDDTIVANVALPTTWRVQVNALLRRDQEEDQSKQQRAKLERELDSSSAGVFGRVSPNLQRILPPIDAIAPTSRPVTDAG